MACGSGEGEQWTVTAADGSYSFDDVLPGDYVLHEVQQQYWVATAGGGGIPLTLAANDVVDDQLFGNFFDARQVPDQFEPNNTFETATLLGSLQAIALNNLTIHDEGNSDYFQFTPPQTGYSIINVFFEHADGDIDIALYDADQNFIDERISVTNNERLVIPTIGQAIYYLQVYGFAGAINVYDLEIEHFAAPVPTQVLLDPADDSGLSSSDGVTNIEQPRFVVNVDLSTFVAQGGTVLDSTDAGLPNQGMWVEVIVTDIVTGTDVAVGVADPIGGNNTLFEFTPAAPLNDGTYIVRSRVVSSDGQQTAAGDLSVGTLFMIDTVVPGASAILHNVTLAGGNAYSKSSVLSFFGAAEPGSLVRVVANGTTTIGEAIAGPDESNPLPGFGSWQLVTIPLVDGTYDVEVQFHDVAGNPAGPIEIPLPVIIDTVPPQRPTIDLLPAFDTGTSQLDNVTRLTELDFRISAEPGSNVVIKDGNTVIHTINNFIPGPDGFAIITIDFAALAPIAVEGPHPLSIESTDNAGNRSAQSEVLSLVIDTVNPTFTSITLQNASNFPVTNINEVLFRGTAEPGVIVRIWANNMLVAEAITGSDESIEAPGDGSGIWVATTGPLPDGDYTFRAEYEDLAGNTATFDNLFANFVVDTVPPQRPTIDLVNEFDSGSSIFDNITRHTELTFRISAETGSTVVIKDGEIVILTLLNFTPNADGFLDVVIDFDDVETNFAIPAEGPHPLSVESTDSALNRSAQAEELLVEIDTTLPILGTPAIFMLSSSDSGSSDSDGITNINQPAFSGYVEANSIVRIYADRGNGPELVGVGTTGSDESDGTPGDGLGIWEITVEPLADGDYTITFEVEDIAGNVNTDTPALQITVNTLSPQRPTVDLLDLDDTGSSNLDNVTRLSQLRFRVSAEPDSRLVFKDGEVVIFEVPNFTPGPDGFGFVTINFDLVEATFGIPAHGPHPLSVEAFDAAGNRSDQSEQLLVTIDLIDPGPSTPDMLTSSDTGISSVDNLTKIQTPAFWGVAEANTIVRIFANGELVGIATVGSDESFGDSPDPDTQIVIGNITYTLGELEALGLGIWEITIEPLADGQYAMTTQIEDLAGNLSELSEPLLITIDTTPPQRPTIDLIVPFDTGLSHFDNITRLTELAFRISAEPGTEVLVKDGETVILTIPNFTPGPDGFLEVTIDFDLVETNFAIPAEGPHPLSVESIDAAGNISAQAQELLVEIDTTIPFLGVPPIFLLSASDSGISDSDGITNINQPAFSGYAEANTIVRIFADRGNGPELVGVGLTGSDESDGVLEDGLGIWEITVEPLADADYIITFEVEDLAGNVNRDESRVLELTIDTLPPQRPTLDLVDFDDTGSSNLDNVTNLSELRLRISAEAGSHVVIKDGEIVIFEIPNYTPGPDGFAIVTIDFLAVEAVFGIPAHGPHPLSVEAFDVAGNRSHQSEELHVTIDLIAPAASQPDMLDSSDSGLFNDDNVTNINTPAFWGVAEANTIIRIYANGELVGMTVVGSAESFSDAGNGNGGVVLTSVTIGGIEYTPEVLGELGLGIWEITIEPLVDGEYLMTTIVEDLAGNLSPESEPLTIWIDTIEPNTPMLDLLTVDDSGRSNVDNITNVNAPRFQTTIFDPFNPVQLVFPDFLMYRIYDRTEGQPEVLLVESMLTQGGLLPNGAFVDLLPLLADGVHNLKLEVEDLAGNLSHDFLFDLIVDTVPPPGVGDLHPDSDTGVAGQLATFQDYITSDKTPTFFGTAEANAIVSIFIDGVPAGGTVAVPKDGNQAHPEGEWQVRSNLALADGLHVVTFVFEDVAGNTSTTSIEIFVDTQGPKITNVAAGQISVGGVPSFDGNTTLSGIKPSTKADPLINSIVIHFIDQPPRVQQFLYDALNGILAANAGNYRVVGDHVGTVTIVQAIPTFTTVAGQPALATVELVFAKPLPDDRYTLFVSDNLRDDPGNRLDGESNTNAPNGILPSGDGTAGGSFTARFTVDSRPELGVYASTSVYIDINGNGVWDPFGVGNDFTNIDLVHIFGLPNDTRFAGKFSAPKAGGGKVNTDGFDKLAAYGFVNGKFRWLIDTNNDGVPDLEIIDALQLDGIPIAGNFNLNKADGDEIGLFTGTAFYLDTTGDYILDTKITTNLRGYPIVGDFDGDGFDDLATYSNNTFYFDFYAIGGWNGQIEDSIQFGFDGVVERPVAADLDQDGIDDIGLFVPGRSGVLPSSAAEWFFLVSANRAKTIGKASTLKHAFSPVPLGTDLYYQFGDQFALPIVGNFDPPTGDSELEEEPTPPTATTTVGLYDPTLGTFFLRNQNAAGPADNMFGYGPAGQGWIAISGDWNGNGEVTVGLRSGDRNLLFEK